jgi:hypothetical protein
MNRLLPGFAVLLIGVMGYGADEVGPQAAGTSEAGTVQAASSENATNSRLTATHKQVAQIKPQHGGRPVQLHTYCLSGTGDLLACVSGAGDAKGFVQGYSPDGELKSEWPLDFVATAINVSPAGEIFVAGAGKLAKLDTEGKVVLSKQTPNIGDMEQFKAKALEEAKRQQQEFASQFDDQLKRVEESLAEEQKVPEAERTDRQKSRIEQLKAQQTVYKQQCDQLKEQANQIFSLDGAIANKMRITALAVTAQDVFVCCSALTGHGYEVWRTDHAFENGKSVLTGLSGCCGQMDVQASNDKLFVAENTRFRVGVYDREGQPISHFGSRDRKAEQGFGSCCNPMNVRCCPDGDILAAESSIGNIKRFDAEGNLVQLVGKAKIGAGCKHVAVAWDSKLDHYYMMHVDKGSICVLWPLSKAPEHTPEELASKQAREGLGAKLVGSWVRDGYEPKAANQRRSNGGLSSLIGALFGAPSQDEQMQAFNSNTPFERVTFQDNGGQTVQGGRLAAYGNGWSWQCVRQDGATLQVSELLEDMEYQTIQVEFVSDNEIKVALSYGDGALPSTTYRREVVGENPASTEPAPPATPPAESAPEADGGN